MLRYFLIMFVSCGTAAFAQDKPPCIFCEIVKGEREVSAVYRNDRVLAFMDHAPMNPGHTLIIPVEHADNLLDLPPETAREMMAVAQKVGAAIKRTDLKAEALQLQLNSGRPVQHVMHTHLHVWPRFAGDFPESAAERRVSQRARPPRAELDETARKIKLALDLAETYESYYEDRLKLFPFEATSAGDNRYNDRLPNFLSEEDRAEVKEFYEKYLAKLRAFDRETLPPAEQVSYDTLEWECTLALRQLEFPTHLMPINQFHSLHLSIPIWAGGTSDQPFKTVRDYKNWLKRLHGFVQWCDSAVQNMRKGMAAGYVLPKPLIEKVIPQLLKMAAGPAPDHLFYTPVKMMPDDFSTADRERLSSAYAEMIAKQIIPAFATLHAFMVGEYLPAGRASSGISAIPDGEAFYQLQAKVYTTTDLTPAEIFDLGQKEVQRILREMEQVKKQVGFEGTMRQFFDHLRTKKELLPFTDPQQVIDSFNAIHQKMQPSLERLFNLTPKTAFEVRRTETFREKSAAAHNNAGTLDGSRPGIFYVPIPDVTNYNAMRDESLFLHEAIPGHHYQISLQREDTKLPRFRRTLVYSAYAEGWALYCESLGRELGLYDDPYQYLGMLGAEMHRAIRLVVDTGLHAKGWTREQAIAYSLEHESASESSIISEIERYMAWPGQALSYKIGQLKIRELRARAEKELGDKFNVREFHDQVLETGCVPLKVLEAKISRWIQGAKPDRYAEVIPTPHRTIISF